MGRTAPTINAPNPAVRFFEWSGSEGCIKYFDKSKGEKGENILIRISDKTPFRFIVLDRLSCVGGFNKKRGGIFSNEVRDVRSDRLLVRFFDQKETIAEGLWQNIKDKVTLAQGKFCTSIYIAFKDADGKLKIGNLKVIGCSLTPWFDFEKKHGKEIWEKGVCIKEIAEGKEGGISYKAPVFSITEISKESDDAAGVLQNEVKEYLKTYLANNLAAKAEAAPAASAPAAQREPDELPSSQHPPEPESTPPDSDDVPF